MAVAGVLFSAAVVILTGALLTIGNAETAVVGAVVDGTSDGATAAPVLSRTATFTPDETCASCHASQFKVWSDSHHAHAMELPNEASVRGDFDEAIFEDASSRYRFFQRDGSYYVETVGQDGETAEFEIRYTFGWTPLQQYLVDSPDGDTQNGDGRLQALTVAWDTEAERWFDLSESDPAPPGDPFHWTGREFNWNFRCADCHSTDLQRNYDLEADRFDTTFANINVGCQSCHGPGSAHVAWAEGKGDDAEDSSASDNGLIAPLGNEASAQLETCAQCHSRRRPITDHNVVGEPFLDHYIPDFLSEDRYFADGQILDEVYVYGSFLQSRMHHAGVTCSDCHDPHSSELIADGNATCTACHNETPPERFASIKPLPYDSPAHHFHETGAAGSFCVDCHMPERTYMSVDPRHDHSFRVPRPDLTATTGAPDACTACHTDREPEWAAAQIADWYGPDRRQEPHFGEALAIGRSGAPGAGGKLAEIATDTTQPGIARATAVEMLQQYLDETTAPVLVASFDDPDPLVRIAALRALGSTDPSAIIQYAAPLLDDPVKAVRITAARILAPVPAESFLGNRRPAYLRAVEEYIESELAAAERPEAHLNLGLYWIDRGNTEKAEAAYRTALRLAPDFVPALINLAELERARGQGAEEVRLLEQAYAAAPEDGAVLHALGLLRVRQKRHSAALPLLARAAEVAPESARNAHVYTVALESLGQPDEARKIRAEALKRHPYDVDLLTALLQAQLRANNRLGALSAVRRLHALRPRDPELAKLRKQLGGDL